ncbi:MAG: hypothetical protein ACJA0N_001351 [Pseudohongiellaceae bacterium]|jgi:hypothetical protein
MGLALEYHHKGHLIVYGAILFSIALLSVKIYFILENSLDAKKNQRISLTLAGDSACSRSLLLLTQSITIKTQL